MIKFIKRIIASFKFYHLRLYNTPIRKVVRGSNYSLTEYNVDKNTLRISLFAMSMLLIFTLFAIL